MKQKIGSVTLVVREYDEAIAFYTELCGFSLLEDTALEGGKRWVVVAPPGAEGTSLVLAQASSAAQRRCIGNQSGGRVFLFLHTDDFWRDFRAMKERGVLFLEEPRDEVYGTVAVFQDLYGNKWDLLASREAETAVPKPSDPPTTP